MAVEFLNKKKQIFNCSYHRVEHEPTLGRYDLRIANASYERDNGDFECRKVEFGTGRKLHSSMIQLVVLLPPSQPIVLPVCVL